MDAPRPHRETRLQVRTTPEALRQLDELAAELGMTRSDVVRAAIVELRAAVGRAQPVGS